MAKVRITLTLVMDYEPNADYYPAGATVQQMADSDAEQYKEPLLLTDAISCGNAVVVSAVGTVVEP